MNLNQDTGLISFAGTDTSVILVQVFDSLTLTPSLSFTLIAVGEVEKQGLFVHKAVAMEVDGPYHYITVSR